MAEERFLAQVGQCPDGTWEARITIDGVTADRTFPTRADARAWVSRLGLREILDDAIEDQIAREAKP